MPGSHGPIDSATLEVQGLDAHTLQERSNVPLGAMASLYGQSFLSLLNDIHGQCLTAYRVISVAVTCES